MRRRDASKLCAHCGRRDDFFFIAHTPHNRRYYICNSCIFGDNFSKIRKIFEFMEKHPPVLPLPDEQKALQNMFPDWTISFVVSGGTSDILISHDLLGGESNAASV